MQNLDKEFNELKSFTQKKVSRFTSDIDELKQPLGDAVEDLKKENLSFVRELERYDSQFKKVYGDYMDVLQEYKSVLQKLEEGDKKALNSSFINHATINNNYFSNNPTIPTLMSPTSA